MESKDHAPVIVVTEIGNCINTWNEVLLGIEEEGNHVKSGRYFRT